MSTEVASLYATLSAETAKFVESLDTAQGKAKDFEGYVTGMKPALSLDTAPANAELDALKVKADETFSGLSPKMPVGGPGLMGMGSQVALPGMSTAFGGATPVAGELEQLGARTSAFESMGASAEGSLGRVGKAAESSGGLLGDLGGKMGGVLGMGELMAPLMGMTVAGSAMEAANKFGDTGHAAYLMSQDFGVSKDMAAAWTAVAGAMGVSTDSVGLAFKTMSKNLEGANLKDQIAQMKELQKEQDTIGPKITKANEEIASADPKIRKKGEADLAAAQAAQTHAQQQMALAEATNPTLVAFNAVGVSVTDAHGALRPLSDMLGDVADKFQAMPDGPEKAGLAIKLFGRSGQDLIPVLDLGRAGVAQLTDQLKSEGAVLSGSQVDSAQQAWEAHQKLTDAMEGLTLQLGSAVAPAFEALTPKVQQFAEYMAGPGSEKVHEFFDKIGPPLQVLVTMVGGAMATMVGIFTTVWATLGAIFQTFSDLFHGNWGKLWDDVKSIFTNFAGGLLSVFTGMFNTIDSALGGWPGQVLGAIGNVTGTLGQKGIDLVRGLWTGITTAAGDIWTFFGNLPGSIKNFFGDVGGWLRDLGVKMAEGLLGGLVDGIKSIPNKLGGIKDTIVGGIGSFFGISSPSTVMRDQVGYHLGTGIWQGMSNALATPPSGLAATVVGGLNAMGAGGSLGRGIGGGGGVTIGSVSITVQGTTDPQATAVAVRDALLYLGRQQGVPSMLGAYA